MSVNVPPGQSPTRARRWVVVFAVFLAVICYMDRVLISQFAPDIRNDLGLSTKQMGLVFSLFSMAYALFEIPGGWMGDKWGARSVLLRVVVWWSCCMMAIGSAWNAMSLMVFNTLFGAGEAGCFPNLTKTFKTWLPRSEQVRAQGLMWFSARWGGAFTPLVFAVVLQYFSWRVAFRVFGSIGVIWVIFFYRWYRDRPAEHPSVNEAELALMPPPPSQSEHVAIPWKTLIASKSIWLLWAQYFLISYSWWFYITWLPTYMLESRGLVVKEVPILAGLPLFLGGIGCWIAGQLTPWLVKKTNSLFWVRRLFGAAGFLGASAFVLLSIQLQNPVWAMIALGMAGFCNDITIPGAWATCMDVGGRYAGTLSGSMNMMGNFGGMVAGLAVGYILDWTNSNWDVPLYIISLVYFLGSGCWLGIDPVTPLIPSDRDK